MLGQRTTRSVNRPVGWVLGIVVSVLLAVAARPVFAVGDGPAQEGTVRVTIPVAPYEHQRADTHDELVVEGFGRLLVPGKPGLPARIFSIAIPPGAQVVDVAADAGKGVVLPGTFDIAPVPLPRVIGEEDPAIYAEQLARCEANRKAVYSADDPYPSRVAEFVRSAGYRKYNLVDVQVCPIAYRPITRELTYYPDITVTVTYRAAEKEATPPADHLARPERVAESIILNHQQAAAWYPALQAPSRGLHDYVIITLDTLTSAVTPLVNWETGKGRSVEVVTTTWINANYTGYDLAAKMRAFLREKYPSGEWGIEDVLLVGHYDDVPMRRTAQDLGYGQPETDFYFAELSLPDNESWDADEDHAYGEDTDPIDFYAEVNVGRIPYSDVATVTSICTKSVAYEQNVDPAFKKNILLLGAFFWDDDPNPRTDNAVLMEAKVNQPWMADWTKTRMYEQGYSTYAMDYNLTIANVVSVWSSGTFGFVNWAGHGSPTSAHVYHGGQPAFIQASSAPYLNDNYPSIVFADSCSNQDTDEDNIARAIMGSGAVGFVAATKVALGCPGWNDPYDGSGQSLDYFFTTNVTSGDYTIGAAHQEALRQMYISNLWSYVRYETFEWGALLGNPNLSMGIMEALWISFPDGLPQAIEPGSPTPITVKISNGLEAYVPGTGTLYYRYDGGTFLTAGLTPLGGNLYQATLPAADCGDTPEYYFSVQGDLGTVVLSPANAPTSVHSTLVGTLTTIVEHSFEGNDQGWTVGDTGDTATAGIWNRMDPEGSEAQPEEDHTPSPGTDCWVTDGVYGGSLGARDVDGGKTTLMSPVFDLSGVSDPTISYYRWYSNDTGAAPNEDMFVVGISNNGGTSWQSAETVGPSGAGTSGGWIYHEFRVADFVSPSAQIKLRFVASDHGSPSLVEAALDDFRITAFECVPTETCTDGVQNQGEERIDCGGPNCDPCECTSDGACNDGLFCTGADTCDAYGFCQSAGNPCLTTHWCNETGDVCVLYGNGDFEPDGDVDLADFFLFQQCFGSEAAGECEPGNLAGTGMIDLDDLSLFVNELVGPQ
ncbi:MAG: hypothetical protein JXB13_04630 [Phycisphaerae bacterium]|nr:hypothetical protein [Phycisphaerae bacterium]